MVNDVFIIPIILHIIPMNTFAFIIKHEYSYIFANLFSHWYDHVLLVITVSIDYAFFFSLSFALYTLN